MKNLRLKHKCGHRELQLEMAAIGISLQKTSSEEDEDKDLREARFKENENEKRVFRKSTHSVVKDTRGNKRGKDTVTSESETEGTEMDKKTERPPKRQARESSTTESAQIPPVDSQTRVKRQEKIEYFTNQTSDMMAKLRPDEVRWFSGILKWLTDDTRELEEWENVSHRPSVTEGSKNAPEEVSALQGSKDNVQGDKRVAAQEDQVACIGGTKEQRKKNMESSHYRIPRMTVKEERPSEKVHSSTTEQIQEESSASPPQEQDMVRSHKSGATGDKSDQASLQTHKQKGSSKQPPGDIIVILSDSSDGDKAKEARKGAPNRRARRDGTTIQNGGGNAESLGAGLGVTRIDTRLMTKERDWQRSPETRLSHAKVSAKEQIYVMKSKKGGKIGSTDVFKQRKGKGKEPSLQTREGSGKKGPSFQRKGSKGEASVDGSLLRETTTSNTLHKEKLRSPSQPTPTPNPSVLLRSALQGLQKNKKDSKNLGEGDSGWVPPPPPPAPMISKEKSALLRTNKTKICKK